VYNSAEQRLIALAKARAETKLIYNEKQGVYECPYCFLALRDNTRRPDITAHDEDCPVRSAATLIQELEQRNMNMTIYPILGWYKTVRVVRDDVRIEEAIDSAINVALGMIANHAECAIRLMSATPFFREDGVLFVTVLAQPAEGQSNGH